MGWPRKNERLRLYFERKPKTYLLIDVDETNEMRKNHMPGYSAIGNALYGSTPSLTVTNVSDMYLYRHCRRCQWSDMPEQWKKAMSEYLFEKPENYRGLWKIQINTNTTRRQNQCKKNVLNVAISGKAESKTPKPVRHVSSILTVKELKRR